MSLARDRRNLNHLKIKRYKSARCRRGPCFSLICKESAGLHENVIFGYQVFSHGRSSIYPEISTGNPHNLWVHSRLYFFSKCIQLTLICFICNFISQNMCMDQCYMEINVLFPNLWCLVVSFASKVIIWSIQWTVNSKSSKRTKTKTLLRQKDDKIQQLRMRNVYLALIHACLYREISAGAANGKSNTFTTKLNAFAQINCICCRHVPVIAELRAREAPWINKSTHPRKFGNQVTERPSVRPHHRHTNVHSHTF